MDVVDVSIKFFKDLNMFSRNFLGVKFFFKALSENMEYTVKKSKIKIIIKFIDSDFEQE